jgi:hypothetical protein
MPRPDGPPPRPTAPPPPPDGSAAEALDAPDDAAVAVAEPDAPESVEVPESVEAPEAAPEPTGDGEE